MQSLSLLCMKFFLICIFVLPNSGYIMASAGILENNKLFLENIIHILSDRVIGTYVSVCEFTGLIPG